MGKATNVKVFGFIALVGTLLALPESVAASCPAVINKEKTLLIRHVSVVDDLKRTHWSGATNDPSDGAWSFGRIIANMAGDNDPSEFVHRWLELLLTDQVVNGDIVPRRAWVADAVLAPWEQASAGVRLDLTKAPMRLLALVFRADERNLAAQSAGHLRFIYALYRPDSGDYQTGPALPFTLVLDFNLPATSQQAIEAWAWRFQSLSSLSFGPRFNKALEQLTQQVTAANSAPGRPNGSALLQIRTNDSVDVAAPWVLREFRIHPRTGFLMSTTIKGTPAVVFNNSLILADWIDSVRNRIRRDQGVHGTPVPLRFQGLEFRGGTVTNTLGSYWDAPGIGAPLLFNVALNTCDGCHGTETETPFTHVFPRAKGESAFISAYLAGTWSGRPSARKHWVADPREPGWMHRFNALEARRIDLAQLLCPVAEDGL